LPGCSSVSTVTSPLRVFTVTAAISSAKRALDRRIGAGERFDRVVVHVLAGELVLVGGDLRKAAHRLAGFVGVLEAVEKHVVVGGVVADPRARAVLLEQVRGVGHALHAARDDEIDRAAASASAPMITVCMPLPQTLLTVVAWTDLGRPALSAACRAGAWPSPAGARSPCRCGRCRRRSRPRARPPP
jgi:hypothetical protein